MKSHPIFGLFMVVVAAMGCSQKIHDARTPDDFLNMIDAESDSQYENMLTARSRIPIEQLKPAFHSVPYMYERWLFGSYVANRIHYVVLDTRFQRSLNGDVVTDDILWNVIRAEIRCIASEHGVKLDGIVLQNRLSLFDAAVRIMNEGIVKQSSDLLSETARETPEQ